MSQIMKSNYLLFFITVLLLFVSCELYPQDDYQEQVFVESYLVALDTLPEVRVSTTAPIDAEYSFEDFALSNAEVRIHLLNDQAAVDETYTYRLSSPGIYIPDGFDDVIILPRRSYQLEVTFPDREDHIFATSVVPDSFRVVRSIRDSTVYQSPQQIEFDFSLSFYPGRQNIYIFSSKALEPENYDSPPIWSDDEEDAPLTVSSGLINQDNYQINDDNTITLTYPWIGIAYYGPNLLTVYAIDDNIYDFFRSQSVQLGGSTLAPGEIQNVFYNVEGGIGLFGSMAGASSRVFVAPPF